MSHKILLADDSVTVQKIVTLTFSDEGVDVVPVNTGEDAIKRLQSLRPALVMADVSIPGKNGYEICAFVKSHPELKHIPVVLLVPAFEPFDEERAARVGADHHLTKPFQSIRTLISTVKSLIEPSGRSSTEALELEWPATNPPITSEPSVRSTGEIFEAALAQNEVDVTSLKAPDTGDLTGEGADEVTEKLPPLEPVTPRDTAKLPMVEHSVPMVVASAPTGYSSHWDDDILELDDVLLPVIQVTAPVPPPPVVAKPVTVAPVTLLNAATPITQSVKVTSLETITTIPPGVIDDIVNRVADQVTAQLSQQLQQFATRLSQDIVAQLSNNARPNVAIPPAPPRRENDSLLDL